MSETTVALELFLRWLDETHRRTFKITEEHASSALAVADSHRLAIEVRSLLGPMMDSEWLAARDRLEQQIAAALPAPVAVWVPAGAELPLGEPSASEFVEHVRQAATELEPREWSHIPLHVTLFLRKTSDGGSVVSATGGLNPHWAGFTGQWNGPFDLVPPRLPRRPVGEEPSAPLLEPLVQRPSKLRAG